MRVVPDNFSAQECEEVVRYGSLPYNRWRLLFESEQEAKEAKEALEKLMQQMLLNPG